MAAPEAAPFIHEKLKLAGNSIRLFELLPGRWSETIRCNISQYAIHRRPPYVALSYTWGSSENSKSIFLNSMPFQIRENLWSFLWHLRSEENSQMLWADAICINQNDVQEKNFQVTLMGQIYERAEAVYAWLSGKSKTFDNAFEFLNVITDAVTEWPRAARWKSMCKQNDRWLKLLHTFSLPYWRRMWIVQEVILNSYLWIHYGWKKINWRKIEDAVRTAGLHENKFPERWFDQLIEAPGLKLTVRRYSELSMQKLGLDALINEFRDQQCVDPRDRVYALLELGEGCKELNGLSPDYSKPLAAVFHDTLRFYQWRYDADWRGIHSFASTLSKALGITREDVVNFNTQCLYQDAGRRFASYLQPSISLRMSPVVQLAEVVDMIYANTCNERGLTEMLTRWAPKSEPPELVSGTEQPLKSKPRTANRFRRFWDKSSKIQIQQPYPDAKSESHVIFEPPFSQASSFFERTIDLRTPTQSRCAFHSNPACEAAIILGQIPDSRPTTGHLYGPRFVVADTSEYKRVVPSADTILSKFLLGLACPRACVGDLVIHIRGLDSAWIVRGNSNDKAVVVGQVWAMECSEQLNMLSLRNKCPPALEVALWVDCPTLAELLNFDTRLGD